ncbi:MAG: hypothetical protein DRN26_00145 [Thermoplasmata archaeon]|nr:MAG: hypothetical protein DRN26_00145 [Thermoplasmata archaeon]
MANEVFGAQIQNAGTQPSSSDIDKLLQDLPSPTKTPQISLSSIIDHKGLLSANDEFRKYISDIAPLYQKILEITETNNSVPTIFYNEIGGMLEGIIKGIHSIEGVMYDTKRHLQAAQKRLCAPIREAKVLTKVREDLPAVLRDFGEVQEICTNSPRYILRLSILLHKPIVLKYRTTLGGKKRTVQVDLGKFYLHIGFSRDPGRSSSQVTAAAATPKYASGRHRGFYHPHVSTDGRICLGDAARIIRDKLNNAELYEIVAILDSLLRTYNKESPYVQLVHWHTIQCPVCKELVDRKQTSKCSYCHSPMCKSCAEESTCSVCGKTICPDHRGSRYAVKCEICGKIFCGRHYMSSKKHECAKQIEETRSKRVAKICDLIMSLDKPIENEEVISNISMPETEAQTSTVQRRTGFLDE